MDAHGKWLAQVHADHELPDCTFRLAFVLTQLADAAGVVRSGTLGKVADVGEPVTDLLGRLVARGHLEQLADGPRIKGFRLTLMNSTSRAPRRRKAARVVPFPSSRRGAFVRRLATNMANMPAEGGDAWLRGQLAKQGTAMRRKGIEEAAIARVLRDLQSAVRAELFRRVLLHSPQEPA